MSGPTQVKQLTQKDHPGGWIMWVSDIHIPIDNKPALGLAIECAEVNGVTRVAAVGDILDFNCLSKHPKEPERVVEAATLLEEVEPGRWFLNWLATRDTTLVCGNHEGRLDRFIASDAMPLYGSVAGAIGDLVNIPAAIEIMPVGSEIRIGNLVLAHGDGEFKNGTGGKHPAQKLLDMAPDQSTIVGHVHRISQACRTSRDERGIHRTRAGYTMGHLSWEHKHYGYAAKHPNWQTGFGMINVWWDKGRPRWHVYQIEIHFDRRNRPYFEFAGRIYK